MHLRNYPEARYCNNGACRGGMKFAFKVNPSAVNGEPADIFLSYIQKNAAHLQPKKKKKESQSKASLYSRNALRWIIL